VYHRSCPEDGCGGESDIVRVDANVEEWSAGSLAVELLTSAGLGTNAVGGTFRVQTLARRRNVSRALRYSPARASLQVDIQDEKGSNMNKGSGVQNICQSIEE
jgi:hypothetical protein